MGLFGGLFGGGGGLFDGGLSNGGIIGGGTSNNRLTKEFLREITKDSDSLPAQAFKIFDEAEQEFHEIMTDGFVEMAIKGNKDYKTSFEIRNEADRRVSEALKKYKDKCCDFNGFLESYNDKVNKLYEKKVELAKRLNKKVSALPNAKKYSLEISSPSYSYTPSTSAFVYKLLGNDFDDVKGRKDSANEYLEDAKDYEVEVSQKIAEINRMKAILDSVIVKLDEEDKLINALNDSLNSNRDIEYQSALEELHTLISEYVLDEKGKANKQYSDALSKLKSII